MTSNRGQEVGKWGESLASEFLSGNGFQIIGRNIRSSYGEIDLIAMDGETIIFVEVKTRSGSTFGQPEESLTSQKIKHMQESTIAYMQTHSGLDKDWRIDVVAVQGSPGKPNPIITWFKNAI